MWSKCPVCGWPKSKCWCPSFSGWCHCGKPYPCFDH